ncbi:MAG: polyprenyl synthetase family protein [Nitrospirota bacterium]|nr:MAG: polyprenyl synthetase family protein [Nitrospirota bacterium]
MDFSSIYKEYETELRSVEQSLLSLFESDATLIPTIGQYIVRGGGKRIRPLFLLASTDSFGYSGKDRIELAGIIEAIHTASLVHDDVVDSAEKRRGQASANSLWSNQIVVLMGDFLYSNALKHAVDQKNQAIMEHLSRATTKMTEGELLQLSRVADPNISEDEYLNIIAGKTGALISAACSIGAIISGASDDQIEAFASFGMKTGMAFQMADDILDYAAEEGALGKKLGKDLDEGKLTLPIIELLAAANNSEVMELKKIIGSEEFNGQEGLDKVFDLFDKYDTINKSMEKAASLIDEAKSALQNMNGNINLDVLCSLADFALTRSK